MITPTGFSSWSEYFKYTLAADFVDRESRGLCNIKKSPLEKIGKFLSRPVLNPVNFILREFKNPLVIVSLTVTLIAIATLLFYPTQFMGAVCTVLPFVAEIKPWMVKFAVFLGTEITILGISSRALGRLANKELRQKWDAHEIAPIFIGTKEIKVAR